MNSTCRILIADKLPAEGLEPLHTDKRIEVVTRTGLDSASLGEILSECDAVIVRSSTRLTRQVLEHSQRLRVIGRAGVGVDNIDVDAATERGVAVLNAPSGNTISAAELTMAMLLAMARRLVAVDRSMRTGAWDRTGFRGVELYGKVLGLVGAGRIGSEVARRAKAFGMRVMAYDPYLTEGRANELGIELRGSLEEVLREADVVSLHVPYTESTVNLVGESELALLKPTAFFINISRGGVLNEDALINALEDKRIAGAALDVYQQEPLPADHPLRSQHNALLTPHLGAVTREAQLLVAREIGAAVRDALLEGDLSRAVNAPAMDRETLNTVRPLLNLAEKLGMLAATLREGPIDCVKITYSGAQDESTLPPLAGAAMIGVLAKVVGSGNVTMVNALRLGEARGIRIQRSRLGPHEDYGEYLEVRLVCNGHERRVAGTLMARGRPRIVRIDQFEVDTWPTGALVILRNRDVPGVIGRVGTLLGKAGVNIAEYHQARLQAGQQALAVISVDERVTDDLLQELRHMDDVLEVKQVDLS